jgi:indole-3-acetate monooxygenase
MNAAQRQRLHDATSIARRCASEIEQTRTLPKPLVLALAEAGCFRMLSPKSVGGLECSPSTMIETLEEVASADGATGWCVMIGATSGILSAFLDPDVARAMFENPEAIASGVFAPSGRAYAVAGGFRVSGRWAFNSGVGHSTWRMVGAVLVHGEGTDEKPVLDDKGAPRIVHLVLAADDTEVLDTWKTSGLRGTGSHDMLVKDAFVPESRMLSLGSKPAQKGALYAFPFYGLLSLGVAGVALGLAKSSLATFRDIAMNKKPAGSNRVLADKEGVQERYALAEAGYRSARAFLLDSVARAVAEVDAHLQAQTEATVSTEARAMLRLAATEAVRKSAEVVDAAYTACGMTSVFDESVLQRNFRDVHVITQHFMVNEATLALTGRVLLGLPIGSSQL